MSDRDNFSTSTTTRRIAIVGGGPGGLMTAYQLQQRCSVPYEVTIYEASSRLGGKILTKQFALAPVTYEAGAAELYDYSRTGEDPLRELVDKLGLSVKPMSGTSVIIDDKMIRDFDDVGRVYGKQTLQALEDFDADARNWMNPQEYYDSDWQEANADPKTTSGQTFHDELAKVPDEAARKYLRTLVHSDLATEPHRTSASYGLQNYLMNDASYMELYTIEGGIERLPQELAARIQARILFQEPVLRVERASAGTLRVISRHDGAIASEDYDFVVVCLPNNYIPTIEWGGDALAEAMHRHHVHYDYPAHYLRVSILFSEIFWADYFQESYLMLDAFGGCCLYDESSRNGCKSSGALGWLLAGDSAMAAGNHTDAELFEMVLDSLPTALQPGRKLFVEGQVHRWIDSVNALPGGSPALDMESRHTPDLAQPNLFVVGDYLFDSTLNGVLDSADFVAECLTEEIEAAANAELPAAVLSGAL